ncbi:MAG TPA: class I SAM-dependent methyltransferase [Bacteroidia bacterium]|nr:class I SAM-dependent methyltransferase [Bacteroidia bacterium]
MKWIVKAIVQKGISFLPYGNKVNFLFQKYITKGVELSDEYFEDRLIHCREHYKNFRQYNSVKDFSHLELGTGWYPVVPTGMFLYGAASITTVDIVRLSNPLLTHVALRKFAEYYKNGKLEKLLPGINPERLQIVLNEAEHLSSDFFDLLDKYRITYMVMDARRLQLADGSIDLITSNNTFEHIYPNVLEGILDKLNRLCKKGGVMSHAIDLSDHFAHMDKSISIYNFLKFSAWEWKWIDNSIQPMNRMRVYDYESLYNKLNIPIAQRIDRKPDMDLYNKAKVHPAFLSHPAEENAVSHCSFVSVIL